MNVKIGNLEEDNAINEYDLDELYNRYLMEMEDEGSRKLEDWAKLKQKLDAIEERKLNNKVALEDDAIYTYELKP